jgi:hypothetical protein
LRFSGVGAKALAAVEEAASSAADAHQVVRRSHALRFAFAFLATLTEDRVQLEGLWRAITTPPDDASLAAAFGRRQEINSCMNGLYGQLGIHKRWEERPAPARAAGLYGNCTQVRRMFPLHPARNSMDRRRRKALPQREKWRTRQDSNLWPLPSEGGLPFQIISVSTAP